MPFQTTYDTVTVTYLSADYARCMTSYGAEITIYWVSGKPDPLPRIGEAWRVMQFMQGQWRFVSKVPSGKYKYMTYAILLDARDCIGRERAVVDDIAGAGFDSVYIVVADYGEVMWDSDIASSVGLMTNGDNLTQLVDRFRSKSIPMTFVVGDRLWSDTSSATHNRFQQVKVVNGEPVFSSKMSYANAGNTIASLVNELYELYGETVNGVCLYDVSYDGQNSDFSYGMAREYQSMWNESLSYDLAEWDLSDDWWARREKFIATQTSSIAGLVNDVREQVGQWPISAVLSEAVCAVSDATVKTGVLGTGIADDIGNAGWARLGFPITPLMSSDESSEMRSFEVQVATLMRYARGCKPLPVLQISQSQNVNGQLEILAKYGAGEVLFSDYKRWRLLTDDRMISLSDAMNDYKVYEVSYNDLVGVVLSSSSKSVGQYQLEDIIEYQRGFESVCSEIVDMVPHRLSILFDSDLSSANSTGQIASLVLYKCTNMTDNAVEYVNGLNGVGVVLVGQCGEYVGFSRDARLDNPFARKFSQEFDGLLNYEDELVLRGGVTDIADTTYSISDYSIGYKPIFGETGSSSYVSGLGEQNAPVIVSDRSSIVGLDVNDEPALQTIVGELVAYAIGRGR